MKSKHPAAPTAAKAPKAAGPLALLALLAALGCEAGAGAGGASHPQKVVSQAPAQTIPLPGVEGRIDHMALDAKGGRLFLAALGSDAVEVIDLRSAKVTHRIEHLATPQGVGFAPDSGKLAVANDKDGTCRLYDGDSFRPAGTVELGDDADNVRYDARAKRFYVGYGSGGLAVIDPVAAKKVGDIKLEGHPESFQLEAKGKRIFVNVPSAGHVAVADREKQAVVAKWEMKEASANFPMALDEEHHRLFVGCRKPAKLVVLDSDTGNRVAALDCVGDTDDLFYDSAAKRVLVSGGEGFVSIFAQADADHYRLVANVPTAAGARTSFFVPETGSPGSLCVAVPHRESQAAEVRVYKMTLEE